MLQETFPASKLAWFETDKCFIDGRWVAPQSRRTAAGRGSVARG